MDDNQSRIAKHFLRNKKDSIVILSDSLSLPRTDGDETILLNESYPYLLEKKIGHDIAIINRGTRFATTDLLKNFQYLFDNLLIYSPSTVIVQIGIVDCAPRLFSPLFRKLINRISNTTIRNLFILPFKKNRRFFTKYFQIKMVEKKRFEKNLELFLKKMEEFKINVVIVNIPKTNLQNNDKSFNFNKSIKAYNEIIVNLSSKFEFNLIDIYQYSKIENILLDDGIHYNKKGCEAVASMLYESIRKI